MSVILRMNDGFVNLGAYSGVKVVERAGHRLLVAEIAGQMVENVIAYFPRQMEATDEGADLLDRLGRAYTVHTDDTHEVVDVRDITVVPSEQVHEDLIRFAQQTMESTASPEKVDPVQPTEEATWPAPQRLVIRLRSGDSGPRELAALEGRRIVRVDQSAQVIALITEGE